MSTRKCIWFIFALIFGAHVACSEKNTPRMQTDTARVPLMEYTEEKPAEWEGLEEEHIPRVEYHEGSLHNIIIRVKFPIQHPLDHYIQKIGVMAPDGTDIIVQNYNPDADYYDARFNLPFVGKGQGYKAFARCSQHDLWTALIE